MILQLISAFIGTVAFSILFNVRKKYFLYCGITGTCGWLVYLLTYHITSGKMIANFLAAIMVMFLSRTFAVSKQCPLTVFLIPGIFPLVPGAGIYYTAYEITQRQFDKVLINGMDTFQTAVVIALAISIIITLPSVIFRFTGKLLKWL
ncbi:threonine/serine exporter family protein [Anaerocolumna sedimenticola]|uniref:Threonine/serine exporter family protein n=1 Tax=Anaerocolumna sedimenticola TaxID=2696063 RepID=A0A6P1THJ2_9FIRM|nr:threonine/serine exporter family protein [Anaerocolumna sedimenticola]QHQ59767.1 threonine/serine exporter family protein [Anaerocolumna sedimenticola]